LLVDDSDETIALEIQDALLIIIRQDVADPWTRRAVASGLTSRPLPMIASLLADRELLASEGARELLQLLAQTVGRKRDLAEISVVLQSLSIDEQLDRQPVATTLQGLARGMGARSETPFDGELPGEITTLLEQQLRGESLPVVRAAWQIGVALGVRTTRRQQELLEKAAEVVIDQELATERRMEHLALLEFADFPLREHLLYALLNTRHPKALQVAAIEQLSRVDPSAPGAEGSAAGSVASRILSLWKTLGPDVRGPAGNILLYRLENHALLLTALEQGEVTMGELNLHLERRRVLLHSRDPEIQRRAEALFTDAGIVTRKAALERMRPALSIQGRPKRGHEIYTELCAKCHRLGDEGVDLGPNLTEVFRKSAESLMHDVIDPNAAVETAYISYTIETHAGKLISGIVVRETDDAVTIREALNKETTIRRDDIEDMYSTGLSFMPEELEGGMSPQTMADLIAFLQQHRH
ncbi:MAG: c-type cytochrome, partial [Candidatus Marinimicrobia bacterium]|nr:c-type cytochrome [Candidatus Neomarinimicrobiota bacterium]